MLIKVPSVVNLGLETIKVDIEINLEQTLKESVEEINLTKQITCHRCQGNGAEPQTKIKEFSPGLGK